MLKLKYLLVLFFISSLSYSSFCQPIFTASAGNLTQTVADIQQIYGSQIDLSSTAIESYISPFVQNSQPGNGCPAPVPQIEHIGPGTITLSWPAISMASSYGVHYLNLNDGTSGSSTTISPGITLTSLTPGLYSIGVYTNCGTSRSPNSIIIADIDIIMPNAPWTCDCDLFEYNTLVEEDISILSYKWPDGLINTNFTLEVTGIEEEEDEFYYSSVAFTYDLLYGSPIIYAHSNCDSNAFTSEVSPRYIGAKEEDNYYNLSFNTDKMILTFPESDFSRDIISLKTCKTQKKGAGAGTGIGTEGLSLNRFEIHPNPSAQQTQINYQLSEDAEVQIIAYDLLGKIVKEIVPLSTQRKGIHQLPVDMSTWPQGIYTVQFLSANFKKTLLLKKVE